MYDGVYLGRTRCIHSCSTSLPPRGLTTFFARRRGSGWRFRCSVRIRSVGWPGGRCTRSGSCSSGPGCGWPRPASTRRRPAGAWCEAVDRRPPARAGAADLPGRRAGGRPDRRGRARLRRVVRGPGPCRRHGSGRAGGDVGHHLRRLGPVRRRLDPRRRRRAGHGHRRRRPAQPPLRPHRAVGGHHLLGPVVAAGAQRPADRGRVLGHRPAARRPPRPAPAGRRRPAPAGLLDPRHGHRRLRRRPGRRPRGPRPRRRLPGPVPGPALVPGPRALPPPGRPRRRRHRPRPDALHRPRGPDRRRQPGLPGRRQEAVMTAVWISVIVVGLATMAIKAAGPLLVARRTPPPPAQAALEHPAPPPLAAPVVTQTLGGSNGGFTLDARLAGLAAATAALLLRLPLLVVITVAAVTAALVRLVG